MMAGEDIVIIGNGANICAEQPPQCACVCWYLCFQESEDIAKDNTEDQVQDEHDC